MIALCGQTPLYRGHARTANKGRRGLPPAACAQTREKQHAKPWVAVPMLAAGSTPEQ